MVNPLDVVGPHFLVVWRSERRGGRATSRKTIQLALYFSAYSCLSGPSLCRGFAFRLLWWTLMVYGKTASHVCYFSACSSSIIKQTRVIWVHSKCLPGSQSIYIHTNWTLRQGNNSSLDRKGLKSIQVAWGGPIPDTCNRYIHRLLYQDFGFSPNNHGGIVRLDE